MKRCPKCERTYTDDATKFCPSDGTLLEIETPSLSLPETILSAATPPKATPHFAPRDHSSPRNLDAQAASSGRWDVTTPWTKADALHPVPGESVSPRRRPQWLWVVGAMMIVAVVGIVGWWQHYRNSPAYSLALFVDAVQRNDVAGFDNAVDVNQVVDNFVPQVTGRIVGRYASGLTVPLHIVPGVNRIAREEMTGEVKELAARAEGKPFLLIALAMPYEVGIKQMGETAKVSVKVKNRQVELTMRRSGSGNSPWKIISVKDYVLAERVISNVARRLPATRQEVEELRQRLNGVLPKGLPRIPLFTDEEPQQ